MGLCGNKFFPATAQKDPLKKLEPLSHAIKGNTNTS